MAVITINSTKDASALKDNEGWSGWDNHHPVGSSASGNTYFSLIYMPISFTGWTGVSDAKLWVRGHRAASGNHVLGASSGNTRTLYVQRMTKDWGEGTDRGETNWSSAETWSWTNRRQENTPSGEATRSFSGYAEGTWYSIDVTAIVEAWRTGSANYGFALFLNVGNGDQGDSNKALEFYARHAGSGYKPYLEITYSTNTAPNAPTSLSPTGDALVNSLAPTMTGTQSDPDAGDYVTAYQIIVYNDSQIIIPTWDSGTITQTGTSDVFSKVYAGPALEGSLFYRWKARTRDKGAEWGPYSTLQRFKTNTPPNPPALTLTESPTNDLTTLSPTMNVTHSDNDPADTTMYGYHVIVETSTGTPVWDSGDIDTSSSPISVKTFTYSGPSLSWATSYKWRAKTKDSSGVWGVYSSDSTFSTHATGVPTSLTPNGEDISGLVPVFAASRSSASDEIVSYQIILYTASNQTQIWDSGSISTGISSGSTISKTYDGTALSYGTSYTWKIRLTGTIGFTSAYSTLATFNTPADATVPVLALPTPNANNRVSSLTPTFAGTRNTAFTNYQIQLYPSTATTTSLGTAIWDTGTLTQSSSTSFSKAYTGPSLAWNTAYKWRVRVGTPTLGNWTGLASFSTDLSGTPILTSPANNAWITTLTPTFTGTSSASESITAVRIRLYGADGVNLIWDSGDLSQTASTSFSKPYTGPTLSGGQNYQWEARYTKSTGPTGNYSSRFIFHPNAAPSIPISLEPTPGFVFGGTLFPTFRAGFSDLDQTAMGDYPSAWVIEIRDNATDALIQTKTLTSGLTSATNSYVWGTNTAGADTGLAYNTQYKWRTWFVDSKSAVGAASSYQVFTMGTPPTVAITSPSNGSNINTTRPTVTWSYSDPASTAQLKFNVTVIRASNSTVAYNSGTVVSSAQTFQVPTGYLTRNTETYTITVKAANSGSLWSNTATSSVQLQLAAPPRIEGLSGTVDEDRSRILLEWDKSSLASAFVTYVIYRRAVGESDWTMIGTKKPETNVSFSDWYAGQRQEYEYRVTVVKLIASEPDLESPDSDIVSARLQSDTWYVIGKDRSPAHIFELPVYDESHTRPVQQESFEPLGSNRKAVVRGFVLGHEGSVQVNFDEAETYDARKQIEYLLYYAGPHILKDPFGDVYDVTFGSPDYKFIGGGHLDVTLTWIEVGATNNPGLTPDQYLAQIGAQ